MTLGADIPISSCATTPLARGLDFRPTGAPPNFETVVPEWPEYVFNSMSGVLPGGAVGVLEHELMEVEVSTGKAGPRMGGTLFDEVYIKKDPFFFQPSYWKRPKHAPFAGNAIWIPTTRLMARVPEAALVPRTMAVRSDRLTATGRYDLDRHGLPGFGLQYGEEPEDEALLDRLFAGPAGRFLAAARSAYVDLDLDGGVVAVRCNGFLRDAAALDEIAMQFSEVVAGVREACAPYLRTAPVRGAAAGAAVGRPGTSSVGRARPALLTVVGSLATDRGPAGDDAGGPEGLPPGLSEQPGAERRGRRHAGYGSGRADLPAGVSPGAGPTRHSGGSGLRSRRRAGAVRRPSPNSSRRPACGSRETGPSSAAGIRLRVRWASSARICSSASARQPPGRGLPDARPTWRRGAQWRATLLAIARRASDSVLA